MTESAGVAGVLRDLGVLYELSLRVGGSMDFRESCRGFLQTLMARKSLDFASVWVRAAHRPEVGRVAAGDLVLAFAHPSFRATRDRLPSEHALVRRVASERHFSVSHGDGDWPQIVTEQVGDVGTFAVYRLGDVGLLKLYSMSRSEPFSGVELGKLHHVVEKFAVSLRGCLDHERVRLAERRSREVEVQMLRAQKLESLGVLAGGIAHDFNNLLTAVLGNAELVRVDPETAGSSVANIVDAARRASELCDQLLAYAGRGMRAIEAVDIDAIVDEMLRLTSVSIPKGVRVEHVAGGNLPAVQADASQLRQVVLNLITNAAEAIDADGDLRVVTGVTELSADQLRDCTAADGCSPGRYVSVEVEDCGCGMDEVTQARLFEPFYSTKFQGRGLGMAAVLGIVRRHRGAISVRSQLGHGTSMRVMLPASLERPVLLPRPTQPTAEQWCGNVLVVDDEPCVRVLLKQQLTHLGFDVATASNGDQAVDAFVHGDAPFDLVLMDMTMPGMSSEQVLDRIRDFDPAAKIVLMSGYTDSDSVASITRAKSVAFLAKPFSNDDLRRVLSSLLSELVQ